MSDGSVTQPLSGRISALPLVLAGPMLRKTYPDEVTVWVALRNPRTVTLTIWDAADTAKTSLLSGQRDTVALGKYLHVVAVTATGAAPLTQDIVYAYTLNFGGTDDLNAATQGADLSYTPYSTPTFSLPPAAIADLNILHGSCRKPHADSFDALEGADVILARAVAKGSAAGATPATASRLRPHALFLAGDQIYADDVADCLLAMLIDAGETLLGWGASELFPGSGPPANIGSATASSLTPGDRSFFVTYAVGFTSGIPTYMVPKSHLMSLAEFYAMYLFVWSEVLWPADSDIPNVENELYKTERDAVLRFKSTIKSVRKALANIPTYMILDDHDVTDDWFMNREFCKRVLPKGSGTRVIQNALCAYAVFQAWGNTPELFSSSSTSPTPGADLLDALTRWDATPATPDAAILKRIQTRVGIPTTLADSDTTLSRPDGALRWHYRVAIPNTQFEVVVFDCRTARRYMVGDGLHAPTLLSPKAFETQVDVYESVPDDGLTLVIVQTPFFGLPWIERKQTESKGNDVWDRDCEAWGIQADDSQRDAYQRFLSTFARRRQRTLILAGDVHYGFAARVNYWASRPYGTSAALGTKRTAVLAQLNASSFHNQNFPRFLVVTHAGSVSLHQSGWSPSPGLPLHLETLPQDWVGWTKREDCRVLLSGLGSWYEPALRAPPVLDMAAKPTDAKVLNSQEWRYAVRFVRATVDIAVTTPPPTAPISENKSEMLKYLVDLGVYEQKVKEAAYGSEIVGVNNIGQLTFQWLDDATRRSVTQTLWWRREKTPGTVVPLEAASTFFVSLDPADPAEPAPITG